MGTDIYAPRDRHDRKLPHRFGLLTWLRAVPGFGSQFPNTVPPEMWFTDADEDGTVVAIISCMCGEQPRVRIGSTAGCRCGRSFAHFGKAVRAAPALEGADRPDS